MAFLQDRDREYIRGLLVNLKHQVKLFFFMQELDCAYCGETRLILEELVEISPAVLSLQIYNIRTDTEMAEKYNISKVPATVIEGEMDYGIRFYGLPSGYEFSTLLEDIVDVGRADSGLSEATRQALQAIDKPLHVQVFVTPTCPHCPGAVRLAHKMAIENPYITADMIEATEFPQLSMQYNVRGVPRTIVDGRMSIEGNVPESEFVGRIIRGFKENFQ